MWNCLVYRSADLSIRKISSSIPPHRRRSQPMLKYFVIRRSSTISRSSKKVSIRLKVAATLFAGKNSLTCPDHHNPSGAFILWRLNCPKLYMATRCPTSDGLYWPTKTTNLSGGFFHPVSICCWTYTNISQLHHI